MSDYQLQWWSILALILLGGIYCIQVIILIYLRRVSVKVLKSGISSINQIPDDCEAIYGSVPKYDDSDSEYSEIIIPSNQESETRTRGEEDMVLATPFEPSRKSHGTSSNGSRIKARGKRLSIGSRKSDEIGGRELETILSTGHLERRDTANQISSESQNVTQKPPIENFQVKIEYFVDQKKNPSSPRIKSGAQQTSTRSGSRISKKGSMVTQPKILN